jgi:dolichyl-phosphate beta-glucosyltransferase
MISIIIPAYNEEKRLPKTLQIIRSYLDLKFQSYEIIVVNDGSTDKTLDLIKAMNYPFLKIIHLSKNMGKGYAVKKGMLLAKGDYCLLCDADLSTPIEEIEKLLPFVNSHPIIIGSRAVKGSDVRKSQSLFRVILGKTFNKIVQLVSVKGISDTQCGFKLFKKEVAHELFSLQKLHHFSFDVEILFLAQKKNYAIKEVPVIWINDSNSKVNAIEDSLKMLKDLLKIRRLHGKL